MPRAVCKNCNKRFTGRIDSRSGLLSRFCCRKCRNEYKHRPPKICAWCGVAFEGRVTQRFCSIGCGCSSSFTTHGESKTRLYYIWGSMIYRCSHENYKEAKYYFDLGVTVCPEWRHSFENFRDWALANGYTDELSIDRYPDNEGNYEPSNCRWATASQQTYNRRITII